MKILDLFCGCGGLSLGMDMNDEFETVIGVDFNADAIKTFQHNFPDSHAICADITKKENLDSGFVGIEKESELYDIAVSRID